MDGNVNYLAPYFYSGGISLANQYPYLIFSLYSNSGESSWTIQNPEFTSISGVATYMTGGTVISSSGVLAGVDPADAFAAKLSGDAGTVNLKDIASNWRFTFYP